MATNFPASLDALTNPTSSDSLASPSHSAQHANVNDAVEALQVKVGADSSAVTSSLDYKVAQLESLGEWGTWTPTVTAETGTITTLGTVVGRYCVVNGLLEGYIDIPIITNGTGINQLIFTLPANASTAPAGTFIGQCREIAATGTLSVIWYNITPGSARINTFANTYPAADGYRLVGHFSYEVA